MRGRLVILILMVIVKSHGFGLGPEYKIIGQKPLTTQQGKPITIQLTDLILEDEDKIDYPNGFDLKIYEGNNYTISGNTVTPSPNFVGTLKVEVKVKKKGDDSNRFDLKIEVTPAPNVPPVITGQVSLSTKKNSSITIEFSHLTVTDPDNDYPDDFTMTLSAGANYSVNGRKVDPGNGFTGTLTVPVVVNDGRDNSPPFNLKIEVTETEPQNTPPVITGQLPLSVQKNTSITVEFAHLIVSDPDDTYPNGFSMNLSAGQNYSLNGRTVTPSTDFTGTLTVAVVVNDGKANSEPFDLKISVTGSDTPGANTPPVITGQVPLTTLMNKPIRILLEHLAVTDPDNTYPEDFTLIVLPGSNYGVFEHTVVPQENFVGELIVRVSVSDGVALSEPFDLKIRVTEQRELDIPTVFTPNNDNYNDTWKIRAKESGLYEKAIVRVFDKRGALVFETTGLDVEWNGSKDGSLLPAGSYFFTIILDENNKDKNYKGVVTILR